MTFLLYCVPLLSDLAMLRSLLLDLNSYGGNDPEGIFLLFCKQVAWKLAPKVAAFFRHLVK